MSNKYFEEICMMTQENLKVTLTNILRTQYEKVTVGEGWVFAQGTFPVCLVAHLDTVHKEPPKQFVYEKGKISSPQGIGGDDRCGVYAILNIINEYPCSVLFCEDEEIGGIGASKFIKHPISEGLKFNYMIELDRKGKDEAVFYDCDNPEFEDFITQDGDWTFDMGSYSDISTIAPKLGCAAVNLSCGYYNAHTTKEYVILSELENCIQNVCKLLARTNPEKDIYEYIEAVYYNRSYYSGGFNFGDWYASKSSTDYGGACLYCIAYYDNGKNEQDYAEYYANTDFEALGMFFVEHPDLCYGDVVAIENYGEDVYNL